jgi:hypothetical protein
MKKADLKRIKMLAEKHSLSPRLDPLLTKAKR